MKKLKRSFAGMCLAVCFGLFSSFYTVAQTNVALNKTATTDSQINTSYTPDKAVDGDNSSNSSRWLSANTSWPHWIEINLGSSYDISSMKFWTGYNGYSDGVNYQFQYWNGSSWLTIIDKPTNTNPAVDETFATVSTTKVRLYGTGSSSNYFRLFELEVYGVPTPVNQAPTVSLTAPANSATFTEGDNITISANASDADGSISKVEFYRGSTKLGEDNTSPYSYSWTTATAGTYILEAVATDNGGATTTSSTRSITVTAPPTGGGGGNLALGKTVTTDSDVGSNTPGSNAVDGNNSSNSSRWVSANTAWPHWIEVDLGGTYSIDQLKFWTGYNGYVNPVQYQLQYWNGSSWAVALDKPANSDPSVDESFTAVSTNKVRLYGTGGSDNYFRLFEIEIYGGSAPANTAPAVSLTAPANGATFTEGDDITISANASDTDGSIAKMEFYRGSTKLGEDNLAPYNYTWTTATAGSYTISAKATDNDGAATTSSTRSITVNAAPPTGGSSNVALGKSTTADSEYNSTYTSDKAVDGNIGTASSTRWVSANTSWPHWIEIDLGSTQSINQLKFWTGSGGYNRAFHYTFEYWNGSSWTTILDKPSNTDPTVDETFTAVNAGKVRLTGTGSSSSAGNIMRVFEVEVYGGGGGTPTNQAPTVSLTAPANGSTFTASQDITLTADASDTDGSIAKVEFYRGNTKIGTDNTAPYSFTWTSVPQGNYTLKAVATDNDGAATTSSTRSITINAPAQIVEVLFDEDFNTGIPTGWKLFKPTTSHYWQWWDSS